MVRRQLNLTFGNIAHARHDSMGRSLMMDVCRAPSALNYLLALNSRNVHLIAYVSRMSLTPFLGMIWLQAVNSAFAFDISSLASLVNLIMASAY